MRRFGLLMLMVAVSCSPQYKDGETECSDEKECPEGYSCSDDGTSGTHYCRDNEEVGCPSGSGFYCSQSKTCWAKPGACSTVTYCGTAKYPGSVICPSVGYHPDCNTGGCLPNGSMPDTGTVVGKGGSGGSTFGVGGVTGRGGSGGSGGVVSSVIITGRGGSGGSGGVVSSVMITGRGGSGGVLSSGVVTGRGGTSGSGGSTVGSSICGGTPYTCSSQLYQEDCEMEGGCVWNTSSAYCSGTPFSCNRYTSPSLCLYAGCDLLVAPVCDRTPTTSYCSGMSTGDICDDCVYTSCCGQLTACINDATCLSDMTGPLWIAYMDCSLGCCGSTCGYL